ncbi:MAG: heme-dependent oxidative N-demethylase subunit alpha family protein [Verrucomicrobiota bacterium]
MRPIWKGLFVGPGGFEWGFRMRGGDAEAFFAPQDSSGDLLGEKRRWLDERPELCAVVEPGGEKMVSAAWDLALGWGQVVDPGKGERDLAGVARVWEPDLLLVDAETMEMVAGCVCFPSSWDLREAAGKAVPAVHGVVPQLNDQIGEKIGRFLGQLGPDGKAFRRENWSVTRSAERNYHPELGRRRLDEGVVMAELYLRVEQQLFLGVPGGVVMGIRIETCPLVELAKDEDAWAGLGEKIETMPEEVAVYKSMDAGREAIVKEMRAVREF